MEGMERAELITQSSLFKKGAEEGEEEERIVREEGALKALMVLDFISNF